MPTTYTDEQGRTYMLDQYGNRVYPDAAPVTSNYVPGASMTGSHSSGRGNGGGGILPGEVGVGVWDGVVGGGTLAPPVSDLAAEPPPVPDVPAATGSSTPAQPAAGAAPSPSGSAASGAEPVRTWEDGSALMADGRVRDAETGLLRDPILAAPADPGTIGGKFGTGTSVSPTTGKSRSAFSEMLHTDVLGGGGKGLRQAMADFNPMFAPYNPQPAAAPADPLAALAPPPGMPGFGAAPAGGPAASTATTPGLMGQPGTGGIPPLPEDPLPTAVAPAPPTAMPPAGSDIGTGAPPVPPPNPMDYGMGAPYASPNSPAAMGMGAPLGMAPPDPMAAGGPPMMPPPGMPPGGLPPGGPPPVPAGMPPMPPDFAARIGRTRIA